MAKLIAKDYDPMTGITDETWWEEPTVHGAKGRLTIRRLQDVEPILNINKEQQRSFSSKRILKYGDSDGLHQVARIPNMVIEKWLREDGFNWYASTDKERRAQLNKRENRYLLVREGRL